MAHTPADIVADLATLPESAFAGASVDSRNAFVEFVACVDENARAKHDIRFYTGVARAMAEVVQSVHTEDFADEFIRDSLRTGLTVGDKPFSDEGWKEFTFTPAMMALALRVQKRCQAKDMKEQPAASGTSSGLEQAMEKFVNAQTAAVTPPAKLGLSFDLAKRLAKVGLENFPQDGLPSEENLAKFEQAGKMAASKGRRYVGSADGECLQTHHRPEWSRTPVVQVVPTIGSLEDKLKAVLDEKKARENELKLDYMGFATFVGHIFQWGIKCVLMEVCTQTDLLAYIFNLSHITEEHGGVRVCYQYDVMQRRAMARSLERGDESVSDFFCKLDDDMVRKAADKVKQRGEQLSKFTAKSVASGSSSACGKGGKGTGKAGFPKGADKGEPKGNRNTLSPQRPPKRQRDDDTASWGKSSQWQGWKKQYKK
ncbi:unnamed protein product [Prorocentrum cordatum]|uniref:RNA helicase n=1 Tax=Prorocentrum cordatum TaxID=2364126 RepID=A0ABN9QLL9_9DINO|nr:unnamed protein product [Polarella glacialis]